MKISDAIVGFYSIHSGHRSYLKSKKKIGCYLMVVLNSDEWLISKKKKVFMSIDERKNILSNISFVNNMQYTLQLLGWMAEWLCSGLQSRLRRFDSGFSLHIL